MLFNFAILLLGLGLLVLGAEYFVSNTAKLGTKLKLNDMFLGITVVALGTSIPEVFVSIFQVVHRFAGMKDSGVVFAPNLSSNACQ